VAPLILGCALAACSSNAAGGSTSGAVVDAGVADAAMSDADAAGYVLPDAIAVSPCTTSLAMACAMSGVGPCPPTVGAVVQDACAPGGARWFEERCGTYEVLVASGVDTSNEYYFDASSGALVAVVFRGISGAQGCVGGPVGYDPPGRCTPIGPFPTTPCARDAGSDVHEGGD
jgi:hypothetical protein